VNISWAGSQDDVIIIGPIISSRTGT